MRRTNKKVYVIFKEKFHGKMIPGTFARVHKSETVAKKEVQKWNALTMGNSPPGGDRLYVQQIMSTKPKGFVKTKYKGIFKLKK